MALSQEIFKKYTLGIILEITNLTLNPHLPWGDELKHSCWKTIIDASFPSGQS